MSSIEIFLKEIKKKGVTMVVNNKKNLLENEKQRLVEYVKN